MYVTTNSGLGQRGLGDLNCPGDPGCPGYVAPSSSDYQTSLLQEILANQQTAGVPVSTVATVAAPGTLTAWMNANGTLLAVGAGVSLLLLMLMGRR